MSEFAGDNDVDDAALLAIDLETIAENASVGIKNTIHYACFRVFVCVTCVLCYVCARVNKMNMRHVTCAINRTNLQRRRH